jgi:L-alanine-DL-glutamate epimerase-like enolase superfamily enzyme
MELSYRTETLRLAAPFRISRSVDETAEAIVVELSAAGRYGYGEAQPQDRYGESVESASAFLAEAGGLLGTDPFALEEIGARLATVPGEMAAKCALDAALHDLCGKLVEQPVWKLLGHPRTGPPTSWTIWLGDPDDMAQRAAAVHGFKRLKLKLGGRDGLDVERVRAVRSVTRLPLMADVNEYWELEEAVENIGRLAELGVEYVEQPLPAGDPDGAGLKGRSRLPIFVDEDVHMSTDVPEAATRAHGINIKLTKSGGIREALRLAHTARALGLGVMLGCMIESGLGIAAGSVVASLCDYVDLDGNLLLAEDPWQGVDFLDGVQTPSERPGLGVAPRADDGRAR